MRVDPFGGGRSGAAPPGDGTAPEVADAAADLSRLSLNVATTERWDLIETIDGCARAGIPWVGLWRHRVAEAGMQRVRRAVRDAGLRVSSLCRGGMFPAGTARERRARIEDNLRAVEEAAALGAQVLVLVCGPAPDRDIDAARRQVAEGVAAIAPHARAHGVRLGLEPLHPMYCGDRSVIVTLAQAARVVAPFDAAAVGVIVDTYHVWWDPEVYEQIAHLGGRIAGLHLADWLVPTPHMLLGRGLPGDGVAEVRRIRRAVEATGYSGPIEVEIFNEALWSRPGAEVLALVRDRFATQS